MARLLSIDLKGLSLPALPAIGLYFENRYIIVTFLVLLTLGYLGFARKQRYAPAPNVYITDAKGLAVAGQRFVSNTQNMLLEGYTQNKGRAFYVPSRSGERFTIPAGTTIGVPAQAISMDPEIFPNPTKFDAFRFEKLRQSTNDPMVKGRAQWAASNLESMSFGYGRHACPNRFFAGNKIKLIMIELLTKYDFKFEDSRTERPANMAFETQLLPDHHAKVLVRKRRVGQTEQFVPTSGQCRIARMPSSVISRLTNTTCRDLSLRICESIIAAEKNVPDYLYSWKRSISVHPPFAPHPHLRSLPYGISPHNPPPPSTPHPPKNATLNPAVLHNSPKFIQSSVRHLPGFQKTPAPNACALPYRCITSHNSTPSKLVRHTLNSLVTRKVMARLNASRKYVALR